MNTNELMEAVPAIKPRAAILSTKVVNPAGAEVRPEEGIRGGRGRTEKSLLLDRAYDEFCKRRESGEPMDPDEFCADYPAYQSSLRRLLDAHRFFEEDSDLLAGFMPLQWPEAGEQFLGFTLQRELGRGAFARVYLATELALGGRSVVIKIAHKGAAEAETLGRLQHPNIVPIHSVHEESTTGLTAVCMPYLGAATLCDVCDEVLAQPTPPRTARTILKAIATVRSTDDPAVEPNKTARVLRHGTFIDGVCHLAVQLADALAFIHRQGICHRDLKPSNVLLSPNGTPMLLDFNLSADARAGYALQGGTLPYMSPEQLKTLSQDPGSAAAPVDARIDLFALGVMLHELLTGRHPFGPVPLNQSTAEVRNLLLERQQAGYQSSSWLKQRVGGALADIIERCLQYDPKHRFATAAELATALRRVLAPVPRAKRWLAHNALLVGAATLFLVPAAIWGAVAVLPDVAVKENSFARGVGAYEQGRLEDAVTQLDRAIAADPSQAEAWYMRGRAHLFLGKLESANADLRQALKLNSDGRYLAYLGYYMNLRTMVDSPIEPYETAIKKGVKTAAICNNLGYCYLKRNKKNDHEIAKSYLDEAIRLDDRLQAAYYNRSLLDLARVSSQGKFPEQGLADIRKAIQLGPIQPDLYLQGANLCILASADPNQKETCLQFLELAYQAGKDLTGLKNSPAYLRFANEPRFQAVTQHPPANETKATTPQYVDPLSAFAS